MIAPYFFKKVVWISGTFFSLVFSLRIGCNKMAEFVQKFFDRRANQKIWFEYVLQIWSVCEVPIGW